MGPVKSSTNYGIQGPPRNPTEFRRGSSKAKNSAKFSSNPQIELFVVVENKDNELCNAPTFSGATPPEKLEDPSFEIVSHLICELRGLGWEY